MTNRFALTGIWKSGTIRKIGIVQLEIQEKLVWLIIYYVSPFCLPNVPGLFPDHILEDWAKRVDKFINLFENPILQDNNRQVSTEYAKEYAESEFEKYRIIQDRLFQSDFDRLENDSLPLIALGLE